MRNGRALTCIVLCLMVALPSACYLAADTTNDVVAQPVIPESNYIMHAPISINSNAEFTSMAASEGWPGDGSQGNPYIVDNYDINGTGYGYCIFIGNTTCYFELKNCNLHDASGGNIYSYHSNSGLILWCVGYATIANNTATSNSNYGICLISGSFNNIINNNASLNSGTGINLTYASNNLIDGNKLFSENVGIWLSYSHSNTVVNNMVSLMSIRGIWVLESYSNIITTNTVTSNKLGIFVYYSSSGNTIYHNNIINNTLQAYDNRNDNWWNSSYPSGGNYWSDYTGVDFMCGPLQNQAGSDGIGDTPYTNIPWGAGAQDNYPLMSPFDYTEYSIPLQQGWNLISSPVRQLNESITSVLGSIAGKWNYIQMYDASDTSDHWKSNLTYRPVSQNDLNAMNHLKGYWINITQPGVTLTVKGDKFGSALSIPLKAGWNLVGYPSLVQKSISNALAGTGYDSVEGFNASDPYRTSVLPGSYMMKPGEGYWVHVPADTVWVVNW